MADSFTATLNLRKPEVGHAGDTWGGTAGLNSDLDIIDAIFLATGLGTAVGLHVGPAQVLNVEGGITLKDPTDTTKVVALDRSLITTATTRTLSFPDEDGILATQSYATRHLLTGTVLSGYYGTTAPTGFVFLDGRTIGDATSGATNRANADTAALFALLWGRCANAQCPVSGGRGVSAATDYAAHKTLALPNHSGRVMAGRDDLSGTPAGILSGFTPPGMVGGDQFLQQHNHTLNIRADLQGAPGPASAAVYMPGGSGTQQTANAGSGGSQNVPPTIVVDVVIAL